MRQQIIKLDFIPYNILRVCLTLISRKKKENSSQRFGQQQRASEQQQPAGQQRASEPAGLHRTRRNWRALPRLFVPWQKKMYMPQSSLPQRDNKSYGATVKMGLKQINNSNNRKNKIVPNAIIYYRVPFLR